MATTVVIRSLACRVGEVLCVSYFGIHTHTHIYICNTCLFLALSDILYYIMFYDKAHIYGRIGAIFGDMHLIIIKDFYAVPYFFSNIFIQGKTFSHWLFSHVAHIFMILYFDMPSSSWHVFWKHDEVIKWRHFPRYWPFVLGIHRSTVNFPHKGQGRGALMFSLICVWINGWVNNRGAGDLRRYRAHYDVTVMICLKKIAY